MKTTEMLTFRSESFYILIYKKNTLSEYAVSYFVKHVKIKRENIIARRLLPSKLKWQFRATIGSTHHVGI